MSVDALIKKKRACRSKEPGSFRKDTGSLLPCARLLVLLAIVYKNARKSNIASLPVNFIASAKMELGRSMITDS